MGEFKDYYKILGVNRFATDAEIKKAYRAIAKECHPDKVDHMEISETEKKERIEKFKAASEAMEALKTPEKRNDYDAIYIEYYRRKTEERERVHQRQQNRDYYHDTRQQERTERRNAHQRQQSRDYYHDTRQQERTERRNAHQRQQSRDYYHDTRQQERTERRSTYQRQQSRGYYYDTRQQERRKRRESTENTKKKETFKESLKKAYQEVREDESKNPFFTRHKNLNRKLYEEYGKKNQTIPKTIVFHCGQGVIHVVLESWYQAQKLSHVTDDTVLKYVLRNRGIAAALAAMIIMGNVVGSDNTNEPVVLDNQSITTEQPSEATFTIDGDTMVAYTTTTVLSRNYVVRAGDTLSELARDSGTSVRTLKEINDLSSRAIRLGETLKIPYEINNEDLQYYTLSIPIEGASIYDIAKEFETDVNTIWCLNKESIQMIEDAYVILSDKILVPNFITKDDLEAKKTNQYTKSNQ